MAKRFNSVWPPPVYCAQFADGSTMRMSFATPAGKPTDYARGRQLCCGIGGREQAIPLPCREGAYCTIKGRKVSGDGEWMTAPGYFESVEYRKVLRHYAQKLIDSAVADLCGTPMPITYKTYDVKGYDCYEENPPRKTVKLGWGSIPLFRSFLRSATASNIVDGWVEKGDETYPDPHFAPESTGEVIQLPKRRKVQSDLDKALALLTRLSVDDKAILAERMAA